MNNGVIIVGGIVALVAVGLYLREKNAMAEESLSNNGDGLPAPKAAQLYSGRLLNAGQKSMADLIVRESTRAGLDPAFMIALALTESSLNPKAIGDDGLSFGLFQLHKNFISASQAELLDAGFNTDAAMEKMGLLLRSFPGHSFADYAEAWTLGGSGRFKKGRRNPTKVINMQNAVDDLGLTLNLAEVPSYG